MRDEWIVCTADIRNKIHEAGLLRPDDRIVLTTQSGVLLEHFTGTSYSYRMVDLTTLKTKRLFSRPTPLSEAGYRRAIEKMTAQSGGGRFAQEIQARASGLLAHIFHDILPEYGLALRENQLSLSLTMLEAMEREKIALCEAEVGTGKTHAYLLAAVIYRLFHEEGRPVVISTSTIALQKALMEEYIPQISDILLKHRIIENPLTFAVRKGKNHYACDSRVKTYLLSIRHNDRPEDQELIGVLTALFARACPIDLDGLPLTDYVKERICVERCQRTCGLYSVCRYRIFLQQSNRREVDFQIANHNLVLADVLGRKDGRGGLFPEHGVLIFDEAHKLPEAARQMYGIQLESVELERVAASVYRATANRPERMAAVALCEEMLEHNFALFEKVKNGAGMRYDHDCMEVVVTPSSRLSLKALSAVLKSLSALFMATGNRDRVYRCLVERLEQKREKLLLLFAPAEFICWLEQTGATACKLCALPRQLDSILYEDLWSRERRCLLTSATLSVGGDFSRFMCQTGIDMLRQSRLMTVSKASPFDYRSHALLYLPMDMPFPDRGKRAYREAVAGRLEELIRESHGHTLVLFTSYEMMESIFRELSARVTEFPLFFMGKGRLEAIREFRRSGNGVLLEYEKSQYEDFHGYLSEVIVPGMLMKLRQWIGRGIRRESDTCVFSILDCRAGGRYRNDILAALPDMPVTDRIEDVGGLSGAISRIVILGMRVRHSFELNRVEMLWTD